jgi:hypothetical protein
MGAHYCRTVLRRVVLASVVVALVASCSSKGGKSNLTPVNGDEANPLATVVVGPPTGFERSAEPDAHNGPLTNEQFDTYLGDTGASTASHLVRAYEATYDSVGNVDTSILVVVAELASGADADKFKDLSRRSGLFKSARADPAVAPRVRALAGVPGGTLIEPTKRDQQGTFDHAAVAARGTRVMFIDIITTRTGRFSVLASLAKQQFERL